MRVLDSSVVQPNEIDGLGHMNVRFYMERAQRANRVLMDELGLTDAAGGRLSQADVYCRYHREQFQGAELTVNGGVVEAGPEGISTFYEVCNPAKGEVAATYVIVNGLIDPVTGEAIALPAEALRTAATTRVELPDYGRGRTIDLAAPLKDLAYEAVADRLADDATDPMSRRSEWTVAPESCDEHGFLIEAGALMFGGWRPPSADEMRQHGPQHGPMTFTGDDGHRLGWASLETRMVRFGPVRAGETLCSIGGEIGLHNKVRHSRRWLFSATTGRLVSLNDNVSIALDLDARRPIDIPATIRDRLETRHVPEFA